jgi:spore maturation protein SpmB
MLKIIPNLFSILFKIPSAIGLLKAILDIVGSEAVQQILGLIHETVQRIKIDHPSITPNISILTTPEQERLLKRIRNRIAQKMLGVSDTEFTAIQNVFSNTRDSEQIA